MAGLINSNSLGAPSVTNVETCAQITLPGAEDARVTVNDIETDTAKSPAQMIPLTKDLLLLARNNFQAQLNQKWTVIATSATGATDDDFNEIAKLSKKMCMSLHSRTSNAKIISQVYIFSAAGFTSHQIAPHSSSNLEASVNILPNGYSDRPNLMDTPTRRRHSAELWANLRNRSSEPLGDPEAARSRQGSILPNHSSPNPNRARRYRWCWEQVEADGTVTRDRKDRWIKRLPSRLLIHFGAALALIVPMLIMSIDPSLFKSLVTSSVFIVVFAGGVILSPLFGGEESITATAAYAAVLFVFVGAGLGPGTTSR
jgi:hypothetical protein